MSRFAAIGLLLAPFLLGAGPGKHSLIDDSPHNFYGAGNGPGKKRPDLCQYCHVPNQLNSVGTRPPLWEPRNLQLQAALDQRGDPAGPPLALRWAGSTLRCLSCHDGTVSSFNIPFRPSSTSLRFDPTASDLHNQDSSTKATYMADGAAPAGLAMSAHPVGVPYPLDLAPTEYRSYRLRSTPLSMDEWVPDPRVSGLKLFTDTTGFDMLRGSAGVECGSCHDPHGTMNEYFLRVTKRGSRLCLSCHRK